MNEQQLADIFSNQLDHLLQGHTPVLPAEASDLQELLDFGQQYSQITFQPSSTAQAAFQGQLASWFGPIPNGTATILGLPKTLLYTFIAVAILVGTGAGLTLLGIFSDNSNGLSVPEVPSAAPQDAPKLPTVDSESEVTNPDAPATPSSPQSSFGETLPGGGNSSLGDTVPSSPSLGDTLTLPTPIPSATAEVDEDTDVGSGDSIADDTDNADEDNTTGENTQDGDHDRGHGNDADGTDEDNPGNSSGVTGGGGNSQGQNNGLGGFDRGHDGSGGQGGQGGNGGQGGGKGSSKDKSNKK